MKILLIILGMLMSYLTADLISMSHYNPIIEKHETAAILAEERIKLLQADKLELIPYKLKSKVEVLNVARCEFVLKSLALNNMWPE